jgi:hypothetical protein
MVANHITSVPFFFSQHLPGLRTGERALRVRLGTSEYGVTRTMTTIIHNVSRVTSAGSSEELAESHVNKTTRLATEDSAPPLGFGGSYGSTKSPPTVHPI